MQETGGEGPKLITDRLKAKRVKTGIAAEQQHPLDIANGLAGTGMGDGARGKTLFVVPHDQTIAVQMAKIAILAKCRNGIGLILGAIDEAWGEGPPPAKRVRPDPGCAASHVNTLITRLPLQDFGLGRDRLWPLRTEQAARCQGRGDLGGVGASDIRDEQPSTYVGFIDKPPSQHPEIDLPASLIPRPPAPQGVGQRLQGAAPGVCAQCRLVENLIQVDLESKSGLWVDRALPDKKDHLQKAVMPAIGTIDAEYAGGGIVTRAQQPRHHPAPLFIEQEDP